MRSPTASRPLAYIGLGSNLGDRAAHIWAAVAELSQTPGCTLVRMSALYESSPVGPVVQPSFLNAVVSIDTAHPPLALLDVTQGIERRLGRTTGVHWGPRVIDLDILWYNEVVLDSARLSLPHPELWKRRFVLDPLLEIVDSPPLRARLLASLALVEADQVVRRYRGPNL